jgi:DMSO/TMAO reductase YedYZ molybdopterin-dependent catalytic subunit
MALGRMWSVGGRLLGATLAAAATGAVMYALRFSAQVRSLPERLLEWVLILVPPQLFESSLLRFGFDTKRYALVGTSMGFVAILTILGYVALSRRWTVRRLLGMGVGLWLVLMLIVMPLTSAGAFAADLIEGAWSAVFAYLGVCMLYVSILSIVRLVTEEPGEQAGAADRRATLLGVGATLLALLGAYIVPLSGFRRTTGSPILLDPQEPVPSGGLDPPNSHPEALAIDQEGTVEAVPTPTANPLAAARPEFPEPRPGRNMRRDADGAVLPAGRRKGELTDVITSNDDFYVVTKNAAGDPFILAADWRLLIDGEVEQRVELGYAALRALPVVETTKTLECISNLVARCELAPFGCDLISNARWRGVRLADVLGLAGGLKPTAAYLTTISADEYTTALPIEAALDPDTLLVFEMNGETLPREHGYPARLLVPGRYGMKNAKWLIGLRPTRREVIDWYGQRHWSKDGFVKTMTRIDVPTPGTRLAPGDYNIAGIAYASDRGIFKVEYSADGGETWETADLLEAALGRDTWVRWIGRFSMPAGSSVSLVARATDGHGAVQPEEFGLAQPDGASGWHRLEVDARGA